AFKLFHARSHAKKLREVPARRAAGRANAVGINLVFLRVGTHPTDRRLHVMHRGGELILGSKTIARGDGNVTLLGEGEAKLVVTVAMAGAKSPAMNAHDRRERAGDVFGPGQVELEMLIVRVGIFDAWLEDDVIRHGQFRRGDS